MTAPSDPHGRHRPTTGDGTGEPDVSVIVIFHDEARFLPEAIASVQRQTCTSWELILVDDGSSDGSSELAQGAADAAPDRVHYLDHPGHANLGCSASRNLGLDAARGRYVAFLDGDDVWEPSKLDEQLAIVRQHPEVGLVVGATRYWSSWDPAATTEDRIVAVGAAAGRVHEPPDLLLDLYPLRRGAAPSMSSALIRRDVLLAVGGFEVQLRDLYEDQGALVKLYLATATYVSDRCWDRYRQHPGAMTHDLDRDRYHAVRAGFLAWFGAYLRARGAPARLRAATWWAAWPYHHPHLAPLRQRLGAGLSSLRQRLGAGLSSRLTRRGR